MTEITERIINPYVLDLNSKTGTKLNDEKIESARYY